MAKHMGRFEIANHQLYALLWMFMVVAQKQ
jgi:hypothetical protein